MRAVLLAVSILLFSGHSAADAQGCPELPPCRGCGCKGGTGYRGPAGACVGFREFERICGPPPHVACAFENAPNTGLNRECALAPKERTRESPAKRP